MVRSQSTKKVAGKHTAEQVVKQAVNTCNKAIDQLEHSSTIADGNNAAAAARALVDALAVVFTITMLVLSFMKANVNQGYQARQGGGPRQGYSHSRAY